MVGLVDLVAEMIARHRPTNFYTSRLRSKAALLAEGRLMSSVAAVGRYLRQHCIQVERRGFLTRWELDEVLDFSRHHRLHEVKLWT